MKAESWQEAYETLNRRPLGRPHVPVIGITGNLGEYGCQLAEGYYESVRRAGGEPLVIPPGLHEAGLLTLLDRVDGLIFSGGGDINPLLLAEEPHPALHGVCPQRDMQELLLMRLALDWQIPVLGICRGIQVMAAAARGTLVQDIASSGCFAQGAVKHSQEMDRCFPSHHVTLQADTLLQSLYGGASRLAVNSLHHQAVASAGPDFRVSAVAPDGVIEAIESACCKPAVGVQWHPETFVLRGDESHLPLFRWLVGEAAVYRRACRVHDEVLSLDTHCDTPLFFRQNINFAARDPRVLVDSHKMREGRLDACIMAAYLAQGERTPQALQAATAACNALLDGIERCVGTCDGVGLAATPQDLYRLKSAGSLAVMKGIENGYAVGLDLANVERFARRGVVYMTLCHNGDNDLCDSAMQSNREHRGLSAFGRQVVAELNRTGIMVDLSHASEDTFYDALEASALPVVCSHSSARALCDHPRNLTDDQLRALAQVGGVAQITAYPGFLRLDGKACVEDVVRHLEHAIEVAGIDSVGIGTDFDGDGGVPGLADASDILNLTQHLLRRGFGEEDLKKIWGGNFLRVMQQVQDASLLKDETITQN
ncbi:MAG: gamma-glutamyl-gamma-aminobutyrate hydrolase family protein [Bacteroidaceae bacterium]|nr:gamma-glutamyl-gamma-aminobutyrate hydrolase family protein [Bacteroidaceae bacterium]